MWFPLTVSSLLPGSDDDDEDDDDEEEDEWIKKLLL